MQSTAVGLDTLLILLKKARTKVQRYEALRSEGENGKADRVFKELIELRLDMTAAWRGAQKSQEPDDRLTPEIAEQVTFYLRALAPGLRRPSSVSVLSSEAKLVIRRRQRELTDPAHLESTVRTDDVASVEALPISKLPKVSRATGVRKSSRRKPAKAPAGHDRRNAR